MTEALSKRARNRLDRTRAILEAALAVFAEQGFAGASMEAVAARAGITKPTLYQYFPSKDALFQAMMAGKGAGMLDALVHPTGQGMVPDLLAFARRYAATVLDPPMLALARLVIGEVQRFPEIGRLYQAAGPDQLFAGIVAYLDAQRAAGRLAFDDAAMAAEDFWGLILSGPRTRALHRPDAPPTPAEVERAIRNGLGVFLRAYATAPAADLAILKDLP